MTKVLIVYATDYGNTKKMAEAVASGVTPLWVNDRLIGKVGEERLEAAKHHGANVARVTAALAGKQLFAT